MSPDRPPSSCNGGQIIDKNKNMVLSVPIETSQVTVHQTQHIHHNNINGLGQINGAISPTSSSKLLVLQQSHLTETFLTNNESNGVGNIVLLATEQMEPSSPKQNGSNNSADEELTSLTWLHDKNLLKGINLSCAKVQSIPGSPSRQTSGGLSPTSDFLEDSCVSEDNTSSINSNSDQGIGIMSSDTSNYHHQTPIYYNNNNNNNNMLNKNRNNISTTSSSPASSPSSTSSLHLSPGGSTIVEYQLTNDIEQNMIINNRNQIIVSPNYTSSSSPTSTSTPHQHFHKKYLREEHVKQMKSQNVITSNNNNNNKQYNGYSSSPDKEYPTTPIKNHYQRNSIDNPRINGGSSQKTNLSKQKHPNNVAYDPMIHTHNKPPFSFSSLIFMAIEDSPEKALPVKEIYSWIVQHFPYFKTAPTGWKNSVRHNLSLSKSFQKVEKAPNMGKGSLWRVDQHYRHNLVQTVTRSQFHPSATIEKTSIKSVPRPSDSPTMSSKSEGRPFNAELFPHLSKYMAEMTNGIHVERPNTSLNDDDQHNGFYLNGNGNNNNIMFVNGNLSPERLARDYGADNIDDVNAATAMLALKHGPKIFNENFQNGCPPVITSSPSEDHTYSQGVIIRSTNSSDNNSNGTSSDAAYESSEESHHQHHITQKELEEQRRHAEGVDALLNLAGVSVTSPIILKRPSSDSYSENNIPNYQQDKQLPIFHKNETVNNSHTPPKKFKSRSLRTKLKKKVWLR